MAVLENVDYADDIGLLSSKHQGVQQKAERLIKAANTIGLKVSTKRPISWGRTLEWATQSRLMENTLMTVVNSPIWAPKWQQPATEAKQINTRISKTDQAFAMLKPDWITTNLSVLTKIKIFRNNALSFLLYGAECWKTTATIQQKLETKFYWHILKIIGPTPSQTKNREIEQEWTLWQK